MPLLFISLNFRLIFIVISLRYVGAVIFFPLVCRFGATILFSLVSSLVISLTLLLLQIILIVQNHNKPKLLLFQNFMRLPHSATTISNFATTEEAKAQEK
jgi:hypothetical protein